MGMLTLWKTSMEAKSTGFILSGPRLSVQRLMSIRPTIIELFQTFGWQTGRRDYVAPSHSAGEAFSKNREENSEALTAKASLGRKLPSVSIYEPILTSSWEAEHRFLVQCAVELARRESMICTVRLSTGWWRWCFDMEKTQVLWVKVVHVDLNTHGVIIPWCGSSEVWNMSIPASLTARSPWLQ